MELSFVTEESSGSLIYKNLQVMAEKMEAAVKNGDV